MADKPRILLVEDEPGIADTLQYVLSTDGFLPIWCSTADEAMRQFAAEPPPPFALDEARHQIRFYGGLLALSRYEYGILRLLVLRPGRVFTREDFMTQVWDDASDSFDRTVDAHILRARSAITCTFAPPASGALRRCKSLVWLGHTARFAPSIASRIRRPNAQLITERTLSEALPERV